jgi:hypothetical protein
MPIFRGPCSAEVLEIQILKNGILKTAIAMAKRFGHS